MGKLVCTAITSLDGYVADTEGNFDWSVPDAEVHAFINDLEGPVGTYLYGRRLYEVMRAWETIPTGPDEPDVMNDYAELWRDTDKIVYSTTLDEVTTSRTRLERTFDVDAIRSMKDETDGLISIGGPGLTAHAIRAGLVDEFHLHVSPVIVGGGTRLLPDDVKVELELIAERRFGNGVVYLGYRVRR